MIKILFFLSLALTAVSAYFTWGIKLGKVSVTLGPFSFDVFYDYSEIIFQKAIAYIEEPETDEKKNNWVLGILLDAELNEKTDKSLLQKVKHELYSLKYREPRIRQIRRLYAKVFAEKMGKLTAAERELQKNIDEREDCQDLIFLGQIKSSREPPDNQEILSLFERAVNNRSCKKNSANYIHALMNIHLRRGHIAFNKGDYRKAIEEYKVVLQWNDKSFTAYNGLGVAYWGIGDFENAVASFDETIIYSNSRSLTSSALYNKALLYYLNAKRQVSNGVYTEEKAREIIGEALKFINISIEEYKMQYKNFPVGSIQMNNLAEMYQFKSTLNIELGKRDIALEDLRRCQELTVDKTLSLKCSELMKKMEVDESFLPSFKIQN